MKLAATEFCHTEFEEPRVVDLSAEGGFALLLVIFILSLMTILVLDFASDVEAYQRSSRGFSEQVQATLTLRSSMSLARLLLEAPKPPDTKDEDWLYEAWNNIGSVPSIPLEGIIGEVRIMIVDEDGKLDLNALAAAGGGSQDGPIFWRNSMKQLFQSAGFQEQSLSGEFRTWGNKTFSPANQVGVIIDWIDKDKESFSAPPFDGEGIEAGADRTWFLNRPLKTLGELSGIPGMTLERVEQIAPFVRVSPSASSGNGAININTAPIPVLEAIGLQNAGDIASRRLSAPYTRESLNLVTGGDQQLAAKLKVNSNEFAVFSRVIMPTRTFWARAVLGVQRNGTGRRALLRSIEFL